MTVWVVENEYTEKFIDEDRHVTDSYMKARKFKSFEAAYVLAEVVDPDGLKGWDPKEYKY